MITGKLEIHLESASLTRDVKLIGSMNPYVTVRVGNVKKTSAVNKKGGKQPKWGDKMEFSKTQEAEVIFEVYNLRKFGFKENDLIGVGQASLTRFNSNFNASETITLLYEGQPSGTITYKIIFTPDLQINYQNGQFVAQGEAPLDMTVKVLSASLSRDTQWIGQMSSYYIINCGDHRFSSAVCVKGGKNPSWADKFTVVKRFDQYFQIDIQNQNNNTNIAFCKIPHDVLQDSFRPGIRTVPLIFENQQAGQILVEISFNSIPHTHAPPDLVPKYIPQCGNINPPLPQFQPFQQQIQQQQQQQQQQGQFFVPPQQENNFGGGQASFGMANHPPPPQANVNIKFEVVPTMLAQTDNYSQQQNQTFQNQQYQPPQQQQQQQQYQQQQQPQQQAQQTQNYGIYPSLPVHNQQNNQGFNFNNQPYAQQPYQGEPSQQPANYQFPQNPHPFQ